MILKGVPVLQYQYSIWLSNMHVNELIFLCFYFYFLKEGGKSLVVKVKENYLDPSLSWMSTISNMIFVNE